MSSLQNAELNGLVCLLSVRVINSNKLKKEEKKYVTFCSKPSCDH